MNYKIFLTEVKDKILDYMPIDYANAEVRIENTIKNNNVIRQGICIANEGNILSPKVYLEDFYKSYTQGTSIEDVCKQIANEYIKRTIDGKNFNVSDLTDFEKIKQNITTKIVSAKSNKKLMLDRPSKRLDDLAIFYQIEIPGMKDGKAFIPVTNQILTKWGISTNELHKIAIMNTERISPATLFTMESLLYGTEKNLLNTTDNYEEHTMFVLTNEDSFYGANVLANKDILNKVSNVINDSYYVIPSSVHEVFIVPKEVFKEMKITTKELGAMVRNVNIDQVMKEERLSDHVYVFDKDRKNLETVKDSKNRENNLER